MNLFKEHANRKFYGIFLTGLLLTGGLVFKYQYDMKHLREGYQKAKSQDALNTAKTIEEKFRYIYQTARTMSFVPGVRKLDRYGKNFDPDAKTTVQQLYNNAYTNIKLSEVYLLPRSLDPEAIDPVTRKPQEPIATFDEFLTTDTPKPASDEPPNPEEVEIYEYRLMKTQLETLAAKYPQRSDIKGIDIPMVSGPEVITCDNAEMKKEDFEAKNDEARSGLVFTVPVYDFNGKFSGGVSAVVRSNVLKELLPKQTHFLFNKEHHFNLSNDGDPKVLEESKDLGASGILSLSTSDSSSWSLGYAFPLSDFLESPEVHSLRSINLLTFAGIFFIITFFALQAKKDQNLSRSTQLVTQELMEQSKNLSQWSSELTRSAQALSQASERQASASQETAASIEEITAMVRKSTENANRLNLVAEDGLKGSQEGVHSAERVVEATHSLQGLATGASQKFQKVQIGLQEIEKFIADVETKTKAINEIVFQTKLLSFNASVEAARAGEHGKGFSVVAEEVGNLARLSGQSADEIMSFLAEGTQKVSTLISETKQTIDQFMKENADSIHLVATSTDRSRQQFQKILDEISNLSNVSVEINSANQEQLSGVGEINKAIQMISSSTIESSRQSTEVLSTSEKLQGQAVLLTELVTRLQSLTQSQTTVDEKSKPLPLHSSRPSNSSIDEEAA